MNGCVRKDATKDAIFVLLQVGWTTPAVWNRNEIETYRIVVVSLVISTSSVIA